MSDKENFIDQFLSIMKKQLEHDQPKIASEGERIELALETFNRVGKHILSVVPKDGAYNDGT